MQWVTGRRLTKTSKALSTLATIVADWRQLYTLLYITARRLRNVLSADVTCVPSLPLVICQETLRRLGLYIGRREVRRSFRQRNDDILELRLTLTGISSCTVQFKFYRNWFRLTAFICIVIVSELVHFTAITGFLPKTATPPIFCAKFGDVD